MDHVVPYVNIGQTTNAKTNTIENGTMVVAKFQQAQIDTVRTGLKWMMKIIKRKRRNKNRSLIKSILTLAAAPKILSEIDFKPPIVAKPISKGLFSDLQLLTPQYYKAFVDKYGNGDFTTLMEAMGKKEVINGKPEMFWFESRSKLLENKS
jgi:hypothetical protein